MYVKDFGIGLCDNTWEILAKNSSAWRAGITSGAHSAEARRLDEAEKKRSARKARAGSTSAIGSEHRCPTCGKDCHALIGLLSHLRTHRPISTTNWLRVVVIFVYEGRTSNETFRIQRCWWNPATHKDHRGGWTQIFDGNASESETSGLSKNAILPTPPAFDGG